MAKTMQRFSTIDVHCASFLILCGYQPEFELKERTVIFTFQVDDKLYEHIFLYNSNPEVKLGDFITIEKTLRGQMQTLRGTR